MKANKIAVFSGVKEILFAKESDYDSTRYGCSEASLEIARKTLEEFRKGGKIIYVSNVIFVAMKIIDWEISKLENILIFVFGREYKFAPMWKITEEFKKWKEINCSLVRSIQIIVIPSVRDEYRIEFEKAFSLESEIRIFSAEFPEKRENFWFSDFSPQKRAELEKKWKFEEWCRNKLPKSVYKWVFS